MNTLYNCKDNTDCLITKVPNVPLLGSLGIFSGATIFKKILLKVVVRY